jgi:hypothetical protein
MLEGSRTHTCPCEHTCKGRKYCRQAPTLSHTCAATLACKLCTNTPSHVAIKTLYRQRMHAPISSKIARVRKPHGSTWCIIQVHGKAKVSFLDRMSAWRWHHLFTINDIPSRRGREHAKHEKRVCALVYYTQRCLLFERIGLHEIFIPLPERPWQLPQSSLLLQPWQHQLQQQPWQLPG